MDVNNCKHCIHYDMFYEDCNIKPYAREIYNASSVCDCIKFEEFILPSQKLDQTNRKTVRNV